MKLIAAFSNIMGIYTVESTWSVAQAKDLFYEQMRNEQCNPNCVTVQMGKDFPANTWILMVVHDFYTLTEGKVSK